MYDVTVANAAFLHGCHGLPRTQTQSHHVEVQHLPPVLGAPLCPDTTHHSHQHRGRRGRTLREDQGLRVGRVKRGAGLRRAAEKS